ncbi:MAG: GMC family oxidoreductase [Ignavibacteriales bacterium]|nr:GMC family oxidoreductase [Ignavibacteriales bacterium]
MKNHYDIIIIGTGAGGGTLAYKLASSGKNILILERGSFLPREKDNWNTKEVFQHDRYHTKEVWYDKNGNPLHPGTGYWVGGNTKVYGAALFRLRERDFEKVIHKGGVSPEWDLKYKDFESYYTEAEKLYHVHGQQGLDPTEPKRSCEYPFNRVSHEPRIQEIHDSLSNKGFNPFYIPLGIKLNEANRVLSDCIRCDTCDGFPCLVDAKADSDLIGIRPAIKYPNVTLLTNAKVNQIVTDDSGKKVSYVETEINGKVEKFSADIFALCAGAINSAAILLKSANDKHPNGLANSSDQVGRNFMKHQNGAILGLTKKLNPTIFQKTLAVNDFYWGEKDFEFPMGHVQLLGKANKEMLEGDAPAMTPDIALDQMAKHSIDWWITAEDLPDSNNRITLKNGNIQLSYTDNNTEAYERLLKRWTEVLKSIDCGEKIIPCSIYLKKKIPLEGIAHQVGTCRFGSDPKTNVLDLNCKTHDVDNLYVVDGSFFPSSAAVNPSLTIMANALRVGEHLINLLK